MKQLVYLTLCFTLAVASTAFVSAAETDVKLVGTTVTVDSQNSGYEGYRAIDGAPKTMWHTSFSGSVNPEPPHWIMLDFGEAYELKGFTYLPRDGRANGTIGKYACYVGDDKDALGAPVVEGEMPQDVRQNEIMFNKPVKGRYFKLVALTEANGRAWSSCAELTVHCDGVKFVDATVAQREKALAAFKGDDELLAQYETLIHDLNRRSHIQGHADQTFVADALILPEDRDPADIVARRTRAALNDIKQLDGAPDMAALEAELDKLAEKVKSVPETDVAERIDLYRELCGVRREILFSNPLLDFDQILFAKHNRSTFNHMCDQYYGINSLPGGGIYVLNNPFGDDPTETDLLADSMVESGRLQGTKLDKGSFISPELSFDGKRIAFAYVECEGDTDHRHHVDPTRGHWHEGRCFHIFTMNADGTDLRQLTDGTWNDFDPVFMPNGRIVFVSERRGGYLRCGRVCPNYTLFDMADDGSEIFCISYHETNEWHPSVTHDGRIIYTRWDYVDRHGCTAHHPWITTPDGRDSRSVHGNFAPRPLRPDMELCFRAIPGSQKYSALAAPHHGQAYGSLIVVDPTVQDDDAMAPVKRVTPEVDFPETQGGKQVYGSPWPLNEKYFLCVYDASMQFQNGRQGQAHVPGNYGIYLVDAFGNKELIHRDASIACLDPIPFRPRPMPIQMTETIERTFNGKGYVSPYTEEDEPKEATMSVVNVYDSFKDWPEDAKITDLRIVQILPMTTPSGGLRPHETGLRLPSAGDSVNLCRYVLGTVPVEEDGSAHFVVPAHREIFFQALDEEGLAVQSMRSSTYLQEGDSVTCTGCHEPRTQSPVPMKTLPLAMRRAPSVPTPDVEGSNPFSYPQLVQPVLDKHCVGCHEENLDKAPKLTREPITKKFYASYNSLAPKYGFWNYGDGYRTTPGKFGAKAAPLYEHLKKGHKDVKLTDEEMHRITLWLDMTSLFYGVYEKEGGEAQLRGETVFPTLE